MGYPMAVNLRSKIGKDKMIIICDVNHDACERFKAEESKHGNIEIVYSAFEAIQAAVCLSELEHETYLLTVVRILS